MGLSPSATCLSLGTQRCWGHHLHLDPGRVPRRDVPMVMSRVLHPPWGPSLRLSTSPITLGTAAMPQGDPHPSGATSTKTPRGGGTVPPCLTQGTSRVRVCVCAHPCVHPWVGVHPCVCGAGCAPMGGRAPGCAWRWVCTHGWVCIRVCKAGCAAGSVGRSGWEGGVVCWCVLVWTWLCPRVGGMEGGR